MRIACASPISVLALCAVSAVGSELRLQVFGVTMTQVVLQWGDSIPDVVRYEVDRDIDPLFSAPVTYVFTPDNPTFELKCFADTNRSPGPHQFSGIADLPLLDANTVYYYRARAILGTGPSITSNVVLAQVGGPVRGREGDLWADGVVGKPDFAQNASAPTTAFGCQFASGVLFDHARNKMYIADTHNNRILGFDRAAIAGFSMVGPIPEADNVAHGASYTKSVPPHDAYPDTADAEFTDGQASTTWTNSFGYPVGASLLTVDVTVDLGALRPINFTSFGSGGGTPGYAVGALTVSVSVDGSNWLEVGHYENVARKRDVIIVFLPTAAVRYVRFAAMSQMGVNGVTDWLFIGEGRAGMANEIGIQEQIDQTPCTSTSDCYPGNFCDLTEDPGRPADIVLGQPGFDGQSAGNGDSTCQTFPYRAPASAATLCLTHPTQISIGETVVWTSMTVDSAGDLFVPDVFNNRVLRYDYPFANDSIADQVWGQDNFADNEFNNGQSIPSASSLNLTCDISGVAPPGTSYASGRTSAGVDIDRYGNLWVADTGNHRVLRFSRSPETGVIASTADVVLGQAAFTTKVPGDGVSLTTLYFPCDVEVDKDDDRVYVADGHDGSLARVLVFDPPFSNGMSATEAIPMPVELDHLPEYLPYTSIWQLRLDSNINGLWVAKNSFTAELLALATGHSVAATFTPQLSGIDLDLSGNLFAVARWADLYRYTYPLFSDEVVVFPAQREASADITAGIGGMTWYGDQFLVCDRSRILIWNGVGLPQSGEAADDLYGDTSFTERTYDAYYGYPHVDTSGRLWVAKAWPHVILQFTSALSHDSEPSRVIALSDASLTNVEGEAVVLAGGDMINFVPVGAGDSLWLADSWNSRVVRISNLDGALDPGRGPYVDVVLGQADLTGTSCNRGGSVGGDTLCYPNVVSLGVNGDLYVSDNGGEIGSNLRILRYESSLFPPLLTSTVYGVPATAVYGTGDNFTIPGWQSDDPICSPFQVAFHTGGAMIVPMNGYSAQRFPLVYLAPTASSLPQMALGDFMSYPSTSYFDTEGNLYVGDFDWSRVLIYRKPLKYLYESRLPGDADGDGDIDFDDVTIALQTMRGPDRVCAPGGEWADVDEDGDNDLADVGRLQLLFPSP